MNAPTPRPSRRRLAAAARQRRLFIVGAGVVLTILLVGGLGSRELGSSQPALLEHPALFGSIALLAFLSLWCFNRLGRLTEDAAGAEEFLADVLDSSPAATAVVGSDGRIRHVNAAWRAFSEATTGSAHGSRRGVAYDSCCPPFRSAGAADGDDGGTDNAADADADDEFDDDGVASATEGLRAVLGGEWDRFEADYRWQGIDGAERWYRVQAVTTGSTDRRVVISHTDATAQRRAEEALRRESRHAHTIAAVAARISASGVDLDAIAETVTSELSLHIGELSGFFVVDEERGALRTARIDGRDADAAALGRALLGDFDILLTEDRPLPRTARERRTVVVEDPSIDFLFDLAGVDRSTKQGRRIRHMLHVPVCDGPRVLGVISVVRLQPTAYSPDEVRLVEDVAARCGFALANVRLFQEKDRAEAELKASEELFRVAFEDAPFGMALIGPDRRYRSANRALLELLGCERAEELVGRSIATTAHRDDVAATVALIDDLLAGESDRIEFESRALRQDRTYVWVRASASLVRLDDGTPAYFVAQVEDRSEQHRQAELEQVRRRQTEILARLSDDFSGLIGGDLQHAVDGLADALVRDVGDAVVVHVAQGLSAPPMLRAARHRDPERSVWVDRVTRQLPSRPDAGLIGQVLQTGRPIVLHEVDQEALLNWARPETHELLRAHPISSLAVLPLIIDGAADGALLVARDAGRPAFTDEDVTFLEEVANRAALLIGKARLYSAVRHSEELFRIAFSDAPHGIALVAPDGQCLHANDALCTMTGLATSEILGADLRDLVHPDDLSEVATRFGRAFETGQVGMDLEARLRHKDGRVVWADVRAAMVREADGTPRYFVVHLADTTEARRSRRLLDVFFANSPDLMAILAVDGPFLRANAAWQDILGLELEGTTGQEFFELIHPEDRERGRAEFHRVLEEGTGTRDFVTRIRTASGRYRWIDWKSTMLADEGVVIINAHDDTVLRQQTAELDRQRLELARSNDDLQRFAHTVSHDLKAPLRVITGFSDLLAADLPAEALDDDTRSYLDVITSSARRMDDMIGALLHYARVGGAAEPIEAVDLGAVVADTRSVLAADLLAEDAVLTAGELPVVAGDPSQLRQLFENLIGNAIKYRSERRPEIHIAAEPGPDCWHLTVRDNGIGIDPNRADHVFEIFKRLEPDRPGAGVGLAICERIVHRHQGSIWVEPNSDGGSCFHVTLPLGRELRTESDGSAVADHPVRGH